ncbi:MAG: HNH endonuclease [Candidatus Cloacimonetes bacterium]|nr:HNH endonuclease [Candidatus Cloacimonadota bacterium]
MNMKDVKLLWGRSGNRCAIQDCRIELSTSGDPSIIGEIAHIIAKNKNGSRGINKLELNKRDEYNNLILLCPTHHTMIDKDPNHWNIKKLHEIKDNHEKWVTKQLSNESFSLSPIDNTTFCENRLKDWEDFANNLSWLTISITPLIINNDIIDPIKESIVKLVNKTEFPKRFRINHFDSIYPHNTRPNENGLINEYMTDIENGISHRIQLFRNGHLELLICLERTSKFITEVHYERTPDEIPGIKIFRYTDIVDSVESLLKTLINIWNFELPFNNMLLTSMILNTKQSKLYSHEKRFDKKGVFGTLVKFPNFKYETVIDKKMNIDYIIELVLKRVVQSFGLVIDKVYNDKDSINRPDHLYKFIK